MLLALACALASSCAQPAPDLFDRPAPIARWDEGVPIGNGTLGVLVWGDARTLRLSLDRGDLWDTRLPDVLLSPDWNYATMIRLKDEKNHQEHQRLFDAPYDQIPYPTRLPGARVEVDLGDGASLSRFRLDPHDGAGIVDCRAGGGPPLLVRTPESAPSFVAGPLPVGASAHLVRPGGLERLGYAPCETGSEQQQDVRLEWFVQTTREDLTYAVVIGVGASPASRSPTLAGSITTNREGDDPLRRGIDRVKALIREGVHGAALEDAATRHAAAMASSEVRIPDATLQQHYDLCKHLYIAGAGPDTPPIALQGLWTADEGGLPPWKGDYHNDLNTQMTYAGAEEAGLAGPMQGWLGFNWKLVPQYRRFATEFYGLPQEPAHLVVPGVMTIDGRPMGGWGQYSLSPTHSAWIAQSFYLHWRYTLDDDFLRTRALPFCEGVARSLLDLSKVDGQGRRRLPLSSSPEIHDNSYDAWLPPNSNYDLALMRFIFGACAEMRGVAGDEAGRHDWLAALASLEPLDVDPATGFTFARGQPFDQSHRHFSHAMAIYPLGLVSIEGTDADRETIRATLDQLKKTGTDWWCGYSFAWAACMSARAGRPDDALDYLTKYLAFTGPNGFHLNGDQSRSGLSKFTYRPFTLEGNFLAMQAIQEMLLQSWGEVGRADSGVVRVFPCVSSHWPDVSFRSLRAEGGWVVSGQRMAGKTVKIEVRSTRAGRLRLRNPFGARVPEWTGPTPTREGADWVVDLEPDQKLIGTAP